MTKILQINSNIYSPKLKNNIFSKISCVNNPIISTATENKPINPLALRASSLAFLGKPKEVVTPDILHKKIQNQSLNVSEKHVLMMLENINKILAQRGIEAYEEDILLTMWTLTQFANAEGMKKLNEQIVNRTNAGYKLYSQGSAVSLGNTMHYLTKSKGLFPYPEGKPETVFMLDSLGLDVLDRKFDSDTLGELNYSHLDFIYPIGWNEGINLFNQSKDYKDFELKVADIIEKAYQKNIYFPNALDEVLTENVKQKAQEFGISDVRFLKNPRESFYVGIEDVKNNLNAKIPTKKEIESICKSLGEYCSEEFGDSQEYWTNLVAKYIYDELTYYSPKKLTEKLKGLYQSIEKNIPEGKTMDDVYFLLPQAGRSFSYINYQFALVNKIPPNKFVLGDTEVAEADYKDKIFVYLDDISASGQTVLEELGGLNYSGLAYMEEDMRDKYSLTTGHIKNRYIIATLFTTQSALSRTEEEIEKRVRVDDCGRRIKDILVVTDTEHKNEVVYTPKEERDLSKIRTLFVDVSHGSGGFYGLETRVIFPYMTPDSNAPILKFLSEKFVPRSAIKTRLQPPEMELVIGRMINKKNKE